MNSNSKARIEGGRRLRAGPSNTTPLVSIISVILNAANELLPLLESISAHRGDETELIVIDGGSQDSTVDILRNFDTEIDYWVSEPDRGIYDAMNKAISLAHGEFILHLNAGDRLRKVPDEILRDCLRKQVEVAVFTVEKEGWGECRPRNGFLMRIDNCWHHQGTFYRRQSHPAYDLKYRVFSDFDCNQKLAKARTRVALFREVVAEQATIGVSGGGFRGEEKYQIIRSNFGVAYVALALIWNNTSYCRVLIKRALTIWESRWKTPRSSKISTLPK